MEKAGFDDRVAGVGKGGGTWWEAGIDAVWPPPLPPWGTPSSWQAATAALEYHLGLAHIRDHHPARRRAAAIEGLMARMDPLMAALVRQTCPACTDPCCRRATLWYDCTDLLVLGFTGQPWPPGQPMTAVGEACRFLGPTGCCLPRIQRPWICTWYLCPLQTEALSASAGKQRERLARWMGAIKSLRVGVFEAFVDATLVCR